MDRFGFNVKIKEENLGFFCRQLATMIDGGVGIVKTLKIIAGDSTDKNFTKKIHKIAEAITGGKTLSEAIGECGTYFPELMRTMIYAGENSGSLGTILNNLATYYEEQAKEKSAFISTMIYPCVVLAVASCVILFLLTYVLPVFADIFISMEMDLPPLTIMLMSISAFLGKFGIFIIVGVILLIVCLKLLRRNSSYALNADAVKLKIPYLGRILLIKESIAICQVIAILYKNGISILKSLLMVADITQNKYISQQLKRVRQNLLNGETLTEGFKQTNVFPNSFIQMIGIAEMTGALDTTLEQLCQYYKNEQKRKIKRFTTFLEPAIIIVMGLIVFTIIFSTMQPILMIYTDYANI